MRSLPLTLCFTAAAAVIALPASAAAQADPDSWDPGDHRGRGSVTVTPAGVSPGGEVELRVDVCREGVSARGASEAFAGGARFHRTRGGGLAATARIRSDAAPDDYEVRVTCEDGHGRATGTFTVVRRVHPSPVAPVRAGGGGTAALAGHSGAEQGAGTRHAVTGLALASVAAAVACRGVRRRRRSASA
ncbi:hypothetical protein ABZ371_27510 [Streptomyces sp. NPDC005899]|uniref:hypothetical protein n=1 Tax=Streptomyces sp. NPDC005899 TaxID=3155716 RepID=UPI0033F150F0